MQANRLISKVPQITLGFWIIKVIATTLGETGGDAVSMTMNWGYARSSLLFIAIGVVAVAAQLATKKFHPLFYWAVIVATTTAGTTMADFATRSLGIGYPGGSVILFALLMGSFGLWYRSQGSVSAEHIVSPEVVAFYWVTILFSQTLGTALGDWIADSGLGYEGGALVFGAGIALAAAFYAFTKVSRPFLFWIAFILTRPLGATLGDLLDKPIENGGHGIDRIAASAGLTICMLVLLFVLNYSRGAKSFADPDEHSA